MSDTPVHTPGKRYAPDLQNVWRNLLIAVVIGTFGLISILSILFFMHDITIVDLGFRHFAAVFGLPSAAAGSLLIVFVTRAISGQMNVEFFGLKFQGAAGEAIIWILCFVALVHGIVAVWPLTYEWVALGNRFPY